MNCYQRFAKWAFAVLLLLIGPTANGALIYESATTITEGDVMGRVQGIQTDLEFYSGVRFFLDNPVEASAIGGHFAKITVAGNQQIFGVIAAIENEFDVPDLETDVVAQTLLSLPVLGFSANISGDVSALLMPGWYALVFGSGRFGATGDFARAIKQNGNGPVNLGIDQTFAIRLSDNALIQQSSGARYFLEGSIVPEPSTLGLLGLGMSVVGYVRVARRVRRGCGAIAP